MEGQTLKEGRLAGARPPAEVLRGRAGAAVRGIEGDFALMDSASAVARVWTCDEATVVLGVSRDLDAEIDLAACEARDVAVVRRASGGGTVIVGPGTLQYAIALPHAGGGEPPSLDRVKRACNVLVVEALAASGIAAALGSDPSGDLRCDDRKVGGVALRRRRDVTLLHGTLLVDADLGMIAGLLRHPAREPDWRRGRAHRDFLANLGAFDAAAFEGALGRALATLPFPGPRRPPR